LDTPYIFSFLGGSMGITSKESEYQNYLIKKIETLLPDCFIIKLDPDQYQGIPDLLILFEDKWAMFEVKLDENSVVQPNQPYYVELFNDMSFACFIYPQNESGVLSELIQKLGA
jgi:hypothetical protein